MKFMQTKTPSIARSAITAGLSCALALTLLVGCSQATATTTATAASGETTATTVASATSAGAVNLVETSDLFSQRDLDASYDESTATTITLSDEGSSATSSTGAASSAVTIDGSVITITEEGTYVISGTLSDGRIVVAAADDAKVQLVFAGRVHNRNRRLRPCGCNRAIRSSSRWPMGTSNSISATGALATDGDDSVDGAIFSRSDVTINGDGSLSVTSAAGHGIVSKDELTCVSGTVSVDAYDHALTANDVIAFGGGTWSLTAGTDGIHASNDEDTSLGNIVVEDGTISITAGVRCPGCIWCGAGGWRQLEPFCRRRWSACRRGSCHQRCKY
jgi:hypothetical protein